MHCCAEGLALQCLSLFKFLWKGPTSRFWVLGLINECLLPYGIALPLTSVHYNLWNADTPLFRKADCTWTVHNSLDNADAHLPLTQVCLPLLIDSTTGHYNSTGMHSTSLWSAFHTSVQQGRALERTFVTLNRITQLLVSVISLLKFRHTYFTISAKTKLYNS